MAIKDRTRSASSRPPSAIIPEISTILRELRAMDYRISVSSLRLDQISDELLDALVESRDQQIAVAPETGSDRLRRVINKNLTNDEIVDICGAVFDRGMLTVKLYMMVGLPTETQEDLDEMFVLVERIKDRMLEAGKKFGRAGKIIPSLNGFVPKPNTPLQWDAICDEKELKKRIKVRLQGTVAEFRMSKFGLCRPASRTNRRLFSSGDRTVAKVIDAAARLAAISIVRFAKRVSMPRFTLRATAATTNFCRGRSSIRVFRSNS